MVHRWAPVPRRQPARCWSGAIAAARSTPSCSACGARSPIGARAEVALQARPAGAGSALVHAVRGRDTRDRSCSTMRSNGHPAGDRATAAAAHRELGYVEVQACRPERAESGWPGPRRSPRPRTNGPRCWVCGDERIRRADYPRALDTCARRPTGPWCGDHRQQAWSLTLLARTTCCARHSQRPPRCPAFGAGAPARWMAFLPLPQTCWPRSTSAPATSRARPMASSGPGRWPASRDPFWRGSARGSGSAARRPGGHAAARDG